MFRLFGQKGPHKFGTDILKINLSGSSGHFSCIIDDPWLYTHRSTAKQWRVKEKVRARALASHLYWTFVNPALSSHTDFVYTHATHRITGQSWISRAAGVSRPALCSIESRLTRSSWIPFHPFWSIRSWWSILSTFSLQLHKWQLVTACSAG